MATVSWALAAVVGGKHRGRGPRQLQELPAVSGVLGGEEAPEQRPLFGDHACGLK